MKCTNATWELRNLGVKTIEIEIEKTDALEKILDTIEDFRFQYDAKYVVVKSSTRNSGISTLLQNAGYLLIENQIGLKLTRTNAIKILEDYREFCNDVSYKIADETELQMIFSEIERGIFHTDRIALDPRFGITIANRRYNFWINDAVKNGAYICLSLYEGKAIGFFMGKRLISNKIDGLLGGIFKRSENQHYGAFYLLASHKAFIDSGTSVNNTFVSSNNLDVLRLHLMLGRTVTSIRNVFVKHFD